MNDQLLSVKQRFGIIGFDPKLDYAINIAIQVASTDLSVLITGESGVGKESFPKIIHEYSPNKHGQYIAVNCGAIPEGTIDSELFGHEKGAFTGAVEGRKGYFEVADGGTIFLDEVGDLPLATQVRLLRVLENGEFMKVGSSKVQKTKVRVVAATNVNILDRIAKGKFREDLYYRLNTVPIHIPALRDRKEDIYLLFVKFANDFAIKNQIPSIQLTDEAKEELKNYSWPGNVRQLRNITEQISVIEVKRLIDDNTLKRYLDSQLSAHSLVPLFQEQGNANSASFERELVFKFLGDLKKEVAELKSMVMNMDEGHKGVTSAKHIDLSDFTVPEENGKYELEEDSIPNNIDIDEGIMCTDQYSLIEAEKDLIRKVLEKNNNKRKLAADELGISERTLYRKIKEYDL